MIKKITISFIISFVTQSLTGQCDSAYTYYPNLPLNVTILAGDTCFYDSDVEVLDSIIIKNNLEYDSPLALGTQTWFNGRLRFLVAGNYGNSSGVNDTIFVLPENIGNWTSLASLYLEWNRISTLPETFSDMIGLQSFHMNNNILENLPDSLGNLDGLYFLDLGYNKIGSLPESICNLNNLIYLWLFNNNLESLPNCFCDMNLDWDNNDNGGYPFFAIGGNILCENIDSCIVESEHFELSLDQFYYSFPVYTPQECENVSLIKNGLPYQYKLSQPYPNPFNHKVIFDLFIPYDRRLFISIFDLLGNEVDVISKNRIYKTGKYQIHWDGSEYSSGLYFLKINDGIDMEIKKLILVK